MPLSSIKGTGSDGRIVKADIEDYLGMSLSLMIDELLQENFCWSFIYYYVVTSHD